MPRLPCPVTLDINNRAGFSLKRKLSVYFERTNELHFEKHILEEEEGSIWLGYSHALV